MTAICECGILIEDFAQINRLQVIIVEHIDYKFKDRDPRQTVEKIQGILKDLGIETFERWRESGLDNCHTVVLFANNGVPRTVGKGVTKEFARASAYAEFIERLQAGLHISGLQSLLREPGMDIHRFAPDAKYMTEQELIENGEWMDPIIASYPDQKVTRQSLARLCRIYACADDGKILVLPFYSLFEKKYVYLPSAFVARMYTANGNCAGNTREEAWVHALSEMMERKASQKMLVSGESAPRIPEETLQKFPTVSRILQQIRENGEFDIAIFDYSIGNGFPVVSTRIIHKGTQAYRVNIAADPVLEIAVQRTLTETFQGKNIHNFTNGHNGRILNKVTDFPVASNVINQLRANNGLYTANYFADESTCTRKPTEFADNSNKSNKELLEYVMGLYKQLGKPVYVRNYSFLGFPSYKFVVPGFSETRWVSLNEPVPEYGIADSVRNVYRNPVAASTDQLALMLSHSKMISNIIERSDSLSNMSGIPLMSPDNSLLVWLIRAYAAYRLNIHKDGMVYLQKAIAACAAPQRKQYLKCVFRYLELTDAGIEADKVRSVLYKFFISEHPDRLYEKLDQGKTPYDDLLLRCDFTSCDHCRYVGECSFREIGEANRNIGKKYAAFTQGQASAEFEI